MRSLSGLPLQGRVVPEFGDERLRELIVSRYRDIYSVEDDRVFIVGVIHGARDMLTAWPEKPRLATPIDPEFPA